MAMSYVNRAQHLVIVPLNTGETVHLAPSEVSRPLEDYEIRDNPGIDKLLARGFVRAASSDKQAPERAAGERRPRT